MEQPLNELEQALARTLRRYLSDILADSLRRRAQATLGVAEGALTTAHVPRLCRVLQQGIRLFVDPALQPALVREIESLSATPSQPSTERHAIQSESDISLVRVRARELAIDLGGTALGAQRAATATSELARNIVAYAGEGWMELIPSPEAPSMTILAVDRGPGIRDVQLVLSGSYRSRTGLGKGLSGVKRLATRFDVATGADGTRVEAEIAL